MVTGYNRFLMVQYVFGHKMEIFQSMLHIPVLWYFEISDIPKDFVESNLL